MSVPSGLPALIPVTTSWEASPAPVPLAFPSPQRATRAKVRPEDDCGKIVLFYVQIKSFFFFSSFSPCRVDVDECLQGLHMCHYNQQCVNTVGAYRCQAKCGAGFKPSATGTGCEGKLNDSKMNPHVLLLRDTETHLKVLQDLFSLHKLHSHHKNTHTHK